MDNQYSGYSMNEREESKKMSMTDFFITALFHPKDYKNLLKQKTGKLIGYLCLLMLLVSVVQYAIPMLGAIAGMGGIKNIFLQQIPDFSFQDGKFFLDKTIKERDDSAGFYYVVDTGVEKYTKDDVPENMMQVMLVSKTNMIVYNNITGVNGMVQDYSFDLYKSITLNNEILADMAPVIYVILFVAFIIMYGFVFAKFLLSALLYGAFMYVMVKALSMHENFDAIYKLALLAQSLGAIVVAVTYCLGSDMLLLAGSAFRMIVTVVFMNRALLIMEMPLRED